MGILMKALLIILGISFLPVLAVAGGSGSQVAWTQETLKAVKNGHAEKGQIIAEACKACHGQRGEGIPAETKDGEVLPAVPALAGQIANYTYKQLRDYLNDDRENESMTGIAKSLSEQDAADVSAWYASISLPKSKADEPKVSAAAKHLVKEGDGKRILPPCFVCHGANGEGEKMDIPSLAGQHADYFERTLLAYKNGQRHNDVYSRMRLISKQLSDAEIKALADYYQDLR
jgi:cytochrome c553